MTGLGWLAIGLSGLGFLSTIAQTVVEDKDEEQKEKEKFNKWYEERKQKEEETH